MSDGESANATRIGSALWISALLSAICYAMLLWLGPRYALPIPCVERPLLAALALYGLACVVYFVALSLAIRKQESRRLFWWIVGTSILLRVLLLPTPPLQEIDIYRYLWDGAVVAHGHDPYAHAPEDVVTLLETQTNAPENDPRLGAIVQFVESDPPVEEILRTIHYGTLTTPYPPVSQAVFAATAWATPAQWSATSRLVLLKGVLTLFDLATLLLVIRILRKVGMPIGWAMAYGWCPLVMKEIAGSGHLDAIAIFLTTASLAIALEAMDGARALRSLRGAAWGAALLLGLGVGAKLYPIILAPLLLARVWRDTGARSALMASALFLGVSAASLAPMFAHTWFWTPAPVANAPDVELANVDIAPGVKMLPPPPEMARKALASNNQPNGLTAFLSRWEMNDLLFMILVENVRSQKDIAEDRRPWFDLVPEATNQNFVNALRQAIAQVAPQFEAQLTDEQVAFLCARVVTAGLSMVIALALAWGASRPGATERDWLRAAFLTIAWFWLLSPTQNPWYWCWALPLLPFARGRAWFFFSAACFLYYLRFWYECHYPNSGVHGTPYDGAYFYYFVVVWWEFAPLLVWLAIEAVWRLRKK